MGRRPGYLSRLVACRCRVPGPLADAVATHLRALSARGLSPYTVAYRAQTLAAFVDWLNTNGIAGPSQVTSSTIEAYRAHLLARRTRTGEPLAMATHANHLVAIKGALLIDGPGSPHPRTRGPCRLRQ